MKTILLILSLLLPIAAQAQAVFGSPSYVASFTSAGAASDPAQPDIVWWKFDGSGTNVTDYSTRGTNVLNLSNSGMRVSGSPANAIKGNGSSYWASSAAPVNYLGTNKITVCYWYNPQGSGTQTLLASTADCYANGSSWAADMADTLQMKMYVSSVPSTIRGEIFTRATTGTWEHIAAVFDNSTGSGDIVLYRNAAPSATTLSLDMKSVAGTNSTSTLYVLSTGGTTSFGATDTKLSDVRIYSGALSASTITNIYNLALHP